MWKKATATTFLFLTVTLCWAQSYNFRVYSIDEGLPQSQVHSILQGRYGFIWLGTDGGGITRFDGRKFVSYTDMDGLSNDVVYGMGMDKEGKLWVGTNKGISIFQHGAFLKVPDVLSPLQSLAVRSLLVDSKDRIWFGTSKGAFLFNGSTLQSCPTVETQTVVALYEDSRKNIWLGTINEGIFESTGNNSFQHFTTAQGLNDNTAYAFTEDPGGSMLVGTDHGLNVIKDENVSPYSDSILGHTRLLTRSLRYDADGNLWVGTWNQGIYKTKYGSVSHIGRADGLEVNGVWCFLQDREKNIWIGTDGEGVLKFGSQALTSISSRNGLPSDLVLSICRAHDGKVWYGHDNGVTLFDGKNYNFFDGRNGFVSEKVWCVFEDDAASTWIATYGSGVFKYVNGKFIPYAGNNLLSGKNVRCIKKDSKGRMWIGTASGLNCIEGDKVTVYTTANGLPADRILGVFEDSKHRLWVGTSGGGLAWIQEDNGRLSFKNYSEKDGVADNVVLSITEDAAGHIWLATFGGVNCFDPSTNKMKKITRKDGLCSNTVYAIACTNNGEMVIGTNNGLDKLHAAEFLKSGTVLLRHFGKEEGFRGVECNTNSILKDDAGRIWIGTVKGVFIYDPAADKLNGVEPLTQITGTRLFFESFDYAKYDGEGGARDFVPQNMQLPYDQNHLTFDFIGLSYKIPEKVRYSYILEGFDKQWTNAVSENFATYTNLSPGHYVFKVRACNSDGKWNAQPATLAFTIAPPFWRTWWFRISALVVVVLSVYGYFRMRMNRFVRTQEMLEMQVDLKTRELREEKDTVEHQKKLIEKKNYDITSSIRYAQRIQESVLPVKEKLNELWPASFVFYRPKDIVSGDFYWFAEQNGVKMVATVDCTGHGVPGAFMSLIGNNLLNEIVKNKKLKDPARILEKLHEGLMLALKKSDHDSDTVDGMDITLCVVDEEKKKLEISATGRPVLLVRDGVISRHKVGKHPLGLVTKKELLFEKESITLKTGDTFYLCTDGYCDQFGSAEDEKFMHSRFEQLLLRIQNDTMPEQAKQLENEINRWRGDHPQIDDMLVVGVRITG